MRGLGSARPQASTFLGTAATVLTVALLLGACKKEENAYIAPPPAQVAVAQPLHQEVTPYLDLTGNTVAVNQVNLEARVEGFLEQINYVDGTFMKKGSSLFIIEQPPYQAKLDQANAKLQSLQADLVFAQAEFVRYEDLAKQGFAQQQKADEARAKRDALEADILDAKAGIEIAKINLGYTDVQAPFDGVVTNHLQSVGALVGVDSPTQLATIVQVAPIWVTFNLSEQQVLRIRENMLKKGLKREDIDKVPVEVGLMTETGFPHVGKLDYAAPEVDTSTGTLLVRGIFDNDDRGLIPGLFARVRVPLIGEKGEALLVPDLVLGTDQKGRYLLVVDKDDKVEKRTVEVGQLFGELRAITSGLSADDRVVVGNIQRAIPGQTIVPQETKISAPPAAAAQP
jgi:membrane fusion protein, multidrug efflux system